MLYDVIIYGVLHSVSLVDQKIEEFLVEIRDRLDECNVDEFECQKKSLIAIKQCDDSHMGEEADRLWAEIRDKTYLFDRLDKEVKIIGFVQLCPTQWNGAATAHQVPHSDSTNSKCITFCTYPRCRKNLASK